MAYTKTTYANDNPPALNADNLNHMEQGIYDANKGVGDLSDALSESGIKNETNLIGVSNPDAFAEVTWDIDEDIVYLVSINGFTPKASLTSGYNVAIIKTIALGGTETTVFNINKGNYDGKRIDYKIDNTNGSIVGIKIQLRPETDTNAFVALYDYDLSILTIQKKVEKLDDVVGIFDYELVNKNISMSSSGWTYSNSTTRVSIKQGEEVFLHRGAIIGLPDYTGKKMYVGWTANYSTYNQKGWISENFIAPIDGYYTVLLRKEPETTVDVSYFSDLFVYDVNTLLYDDYKNLFPEGSQIDISQLGNGYFQTNGTVTGASANQEKYTINYLKVTPGKTYRFIMGVPLKATTWGRIITYDGSKAVAGNMTIGTGYANIFDYIYNGIGYRAYDFTAGTGVEYVRISWRTYGVSWAILYDVNDLISDSVAKAMKNVGNDELYRGMNNIKSVNHMGYFTAPEDTLPAYKLSRQMGFRFVETDVSFTSDSVPVLLHDNTINRTARNADGTAISETIYIYDITYEEALEYDFGIYKNAQYAGTKIPTLKQFMILCKNLGLHPYIELKSTGNYTDEQITKCLDIVKSLDMMENVTWISFYSGYLDIVKEYDDTARIGLVVSGIDASAISTASALKTGKNEVFIDSSTYTQSEIELCIENDLGLEVWTLDDYNTIKSLHEYISGVTSGRFNASAIKFIETE